MACTSHNRNNLLSRSTHPHPSRVVTSNVMAANEHAAFNVALGKFKCAEILFLKLAEDLLNREHVNTRVFGPRQDAVQHETSGNDSSESQKDDPVRIDNDNIEIILPNDPLIDLNHAMSESAAQGQYLTQELPL